MLIVLTVSFRDLRQTAELIGGRLVQIGPAVMASTWRPAILSLYKYATLAAI